MITKESKSAQESNLKISFLIEKDSNDVLSESNGYSLYKNVLQKRVNSLQVTPDKNSSLIIEELPNLTEEESKDTPSAKSSSKTEEGYSSRFNARNKSRDDFNRRSNSIEYVKKTKASSIRRQKNKHSVGSDQLKIVDLSKENSNHSTKSVELNLSPAAPETINTSDLKPAKVLSKFAKTNNSVKSKKSKITKIKSSNENSTLNQKHKLLTSLFQNRAREINQNNANEEDNSQLNFKKSLASSEPKADLSKFKMIKNKQMEQEHKLKIHEESKKTQNIQSRPIDRRKLYQQKKKTDSIENFNIFFNSLDSFEGNNFIHPKKRRKSEFKIREPSLDGYNRKISSTKRIRNISQIDVNSKYLKNIHSSNRSRSLCNLTIPQRELFRRRRLLSDFHELPMTKLNISTELFTGLNVFRKLDQNQLQNKNAKVLQEDQESAESSLSSEGIFIKPNNI